MIGSILLVSHNNLHLTKRAVKSALAQDVSCDVLVVDNSSTDGTQDWLKSKVVSHSLLPSQLSLAQCWNKGLKAFWPISDAVLVCNNDIVLRPDTFRLLYEHGGEFVTCVSVDNEAQLYTPGDRTIEDLRRSDRAHPDFSCFLIRKPVVEKVGWFDEGNYPAYYEDNDYHVRMERAGVRALCVDLPFLHIGAQTVKNASDGEKSRIYRSAAANREKFKAKYGCYPGTPEYERLFT